MKIPRESFPRRAVGPAIFVVAAGLACSEVPDGSASSSGAQSSSSDASLASASSQASSSAAVGGVPTGTSSTGTDGAGSQAVGGTDAGVTSVSSGTGGGSSAGPSSIASGTGGTSVTGEAAGGSGGANTGTTFGAATGTATGDGSGGSTGGSSGGSGGTQGMDGGGTVGTTGGDDCNLPETVSFQTHLQPFLTTACGGGNGCHVIDDQSTMANGGYNHAYDWVTAGAHTSSCPDGPFRFEVLLDVVDQANPPSCANSRKMPPPDESGANLRTPLTPCEVAALEAWLSLPRVTQTHRPDDTSPTDPYPMPPFN